MLGKLQRLGRWVLRIYSIFWQVKVIALKNVAILGSGNARTNRGEIQHDVRFGAR